MPLELGNEERQEGAIELVARLAPELGDRLRHRRGSPVWTVVGHRVERIDKPHDSGAERDLLAAQAVGIAPTVPTLVMMADDWGEALRRAQGPADPLADLRMLAHELPLGIIERARFREDGLGNPDLADVVEQGPTPESRYLQPSARRC